MADHQANGCVASPGPGLWRWGLRLGLCLWALGLMLSGAVAQAEPSPYEVEALQQEARAAFLHVVELWQGEMFFELYDEGWSDSQERIQQDAFAQRMVELAWAPAEKPEAKAVKTTLRYRTMVYVNVRLVFRNKYKTDKQIVRDQQFLMLKENNRWRMDLIQLLRAPY